MSPTSQSRNLYLAREGGILKLHRSQLDPEASHPKKPGAIEVLFACGNNGGMAGHREVGFRWPTKSIW